MVYELAETQLPGLSLLHTQKQKPTAKQCAVTLGPMKSFSQVAFFLPSFDPITEWAELPCSRGNRKSIGVAESWTALTVQPREHPAAVANTMVEWQQQQQPAAMNVVASATGATV